MSHRISRNEFAGCIRRALDKVPQDAETEAALVNVAINASEFKRASYDLCPLALAGVVSNAHPPTEEQEWWALTFDAEVRPFTIEAAYGTPVQVID